MKILIVDDSVHVHRQLQVFLASDGYSDLVFVSSATEAFRCLGLEGDGHPPPIAVDLILMDIEMDDIRGIEATRRIKGEPSFTDVPVVMVTADTSPESLSKAFEAGAVDYINKPIRKIELLARVRSLLRLRQETLTRKAWEADLVKLAAELEHTNRELQHANETLARIAASDGLTGVANRRYFDKTLAQEWRRAQRRGLDIALLMLDIDHFKSYNDTYGHQAGDACICQVANALTSVARRAGEFVARYGGEEFAIVLPETDLLGATLVAQQALAAIAELGLPHAGKGANGHVTISIGVASRQVHQNEHWEPLIRAADEALYLAKRQGRNRLEVAEH